VQLPARPGGAQVAPPGGGGGNTPAASGSGKLPGVRGPGARSFSAPQVASAASAASNASMPLSASAGLVVRRYRRVTMYRTSGFDGVVRLVAVLLHRIAVSSRGSVCYLNGRRMRMLLSLDAPFHPVDLSVVYSLLVRFGFEVVRRRGKYVVIRMDNPIMREVKGARSFDEVLEIVKKHLSNGG